MSQTPSGMKPPHATAHNTSTENSVAAQAVSFGRLLVVFGPVLALVAFTALLAMTAWFVGWYRTEMLVAAAGAGTIVVLLATLLLYRQTQSRQAVHRAWQSADA